MNTVTLSALFGLFLNAYAVSQQTIKCGSNSNCRLKGNQTSIIIADKSVKSLIIDCIGDSKCKKNGINPGLIIYSSANITTINCDGENTCEEINIYLGITPPNSNSLLFEVNRNLAIINCPEKCSCKNINIETEGKLTKGLSVILPTLLNNGGAFNQGNILCNNKDTTCTMQCGNIIDMCKDSKCLGNGNCVCVGESCPNDFNIEPTVKPTTLPTIKPALTSRPTPSPLAPRNITICKQGECILKPSNNYDVDCSKTAIKCRIECIGDSKCQNGVIINANSNQVELDCRGKNACDKVEIINNEKSSIVIKVDDDAGGQNMKIIIENKLTIISIYIDGKDGFSNGELICNGKLCEMMCMGINACKTALFECLTNNNKCKCKSMDNTCPNILYYGDSNCNNNINNCILSPNGNKRIVLTNNINNVEINCLNEKQCKKYGNGLTIFTAAKSTIINCKNKDACEGILIKAGSLNGDDLPKGFDENDFTTPSLALNEKQRLKIICDNEDSCKSLSLLTTGDIETTIIGDGEDALAYSNIICNKCSKLNLECLEFRGCPFSSLKCNPLNNCKCESIYVHVNLTEVTTSEPRNSCPLPQLLLRKKSINIKESQNILSNNNNNNNNINKILIPLLILFLLIILCVGYIIYNKSDKYNSIENDKSLILQNINNCTTYQNTHIEMH